MLRAWLARLREGRRTGAPPAADAEALVRDALAARAAGDAAAAERLLYRALALAPDAAGVQFHLGDLFRAQGRADAALQCCEAGVRLAPEFAPGRNNLGSALRDAGRAGEAEAEYRRAIALDPRLPEAHYNLGVLLAKRGDLGGAEAAFREAASLRPGFALAQLNLGFALEERGEHAGAAQAYAAAAAADPSLVEAHVNLGMQLLLAGDFARGWEEYEWRRRYPEYAAEPPGATRWRGEPLQGRTILLEGEQGFGDAIQFVRYAVPLSAKGARVLVRCAPELERLFRGAKGVADVVPAGSAAHGAEFWCPLPSLPHAFRTPPEAVPADVPYLSADPGDAVRWSSTLRAECGRSNGPRVGLVWASQSGHRTAADKSVALADLLPLSETPGATFVSLQKGAAAAQAGALGPRWKLLDAARDLRDFADTAALIESLDLVISVDTAVAHLAGAMGKPTWTLLKRAPDWRWQLGREDCPWYPTMRLFRQERRGDWHGPVLALCAALRGWAAQRASG